MNIKRTQNYLFILYVLNKNYIMLLDQIYFNHILIILIV